MRSGVDPRDSLKMQQRVPDEESNGVWPLHRHSVVDGGDIVGIMQGIDPAIRYRTPLITVFPCRMVAAPL